MSRAIAVYHGDFGRAGLYQLNRPIITHAHREGHLIFHLGGPPARLGIGKRSWASSGEFGLGVNPWQPHSYAPPDAEAGALFLVLYVKPSWFSAGSGGKPFLRFGRSDIPGTPTIARLVAGVSSLLQVGRATAGVDQLLIELTGECMEASWRGREVEDSDPGPVRDHRVRRSIRILSEAGCADLPLDRVARQAGLSRPHFYRLFRQETGLTPNLYLKTLVVERAIERVAGSDQSVTEIGIDLGFSSQSGFTRFFAAHVGMAPTNYRQVALSRLQ